MTLKVKIDSARREEIFYATNDGVIVTPAGALTLVSEWALSSQGTRVPVEFKIIAPGLWNTVIATQHPDE